MKVRSQQIRHPLRSRPGFVPALVAGQLVGITLSTCIAAALLATAGPVGAVLGGLLVCAAILPGPLFGTAAATLFVGDDGVRIHAWGRSRFVPYRDVREARVLADRVVLVLASGREEHLRGTRPGRRVPVDAPIDPEIVQRIGDGVARARSAREPERFEAELARGDRDIRDWLAGVIARAGGGGRDYREASLDRSALARLAADPDAPASARAASAMLLRRTGLREEERRVLAEAAERTVQPRLQVALASAADESVDEPRLDAAVTHAAE